MTKDDPEPAGDTAEPVSRIERLRRHLRLLYHGHTPRAVRFQAAALVVDLAIIVFFIFSPVLRDEPWFLWLDLSIAALLAADLLARGLATSNVGKWLRQPTVVIDVVILLTLMFPLLFANFGFLRILRLWTLTRGERFWRPIDRSPIGQYREPIKATVDLVVFLFLLTGFIYTAFGYRGAGIESYIQALYFTVSTVTTTGYGDITLPGPAGRLTSIFAMIIGITLFFRLAQTIVLPAKVLFPCPECGLRRHDRDAVHCKACGHVLNIPDDGR